MPYGKSQLGCIGVDGKVYAIGVGTITVNYDKVYPAGDYNSVYDPKTNSWTMKKSMPSVRLSFGIAAWESKIYCIGGEYGPVGTNEVYDIATDSWTNMTSMPTARSYLCASAVDGKIYLIGGSTTSFGRPSNLNEVYDIATDTWTTKTPMPKAVYSYASAVLNNKIYIIGGISPNEENILQIYDCKTNNWSYGAPLPVNIRGAAAVATLGYHAPERIYVFGGYVSGGNLAADYNWVYDPANDSWTNGKALPTHRRDMGAANINDQLYIIGGHIDETHTSSRINERYTPIGYSQEPLKTSPPPTGNTQPMLPTVSIIAGAVIAATVVAVAGVVVYHFKHAPVKASNPS
jgi:N-acetylneuraminic acid mutarotase